MVNLREQTAPPHTHTEKGRRVGEKHFKNIIQKTDPKTFSLKIVQLGVGEEGVKSHLVSDLVRLKFLHCNTGLPKPRQEEAETSV